MRCAPPGGAIPQFGLPKYRSGLAQPTANQGRGPALHFVLVQMGSLGSSPVTRYTSWQATETAWSANLSQ
jgi:hypothetical protein